MSTQPVPSRQTKHKNQPVRKPKPPPAEARSDVPGWQRRERALAPKPMSLPAKAWDTRPRLPSPPPAKWKDKPTAGSGDSWWLNALVSPSKKGTTESPTQEQRVSDSADDDAPSSPDDEFAPDTDIPQAAPEDEPAPELELQPEMQPELESDDPKPLTSEPVKLLSLQSFDDEQFAADLIRGFNLNELDQILAVTKIAAVIRGKAARRRVARIQVRAAALEAMMGPEPEYSDGSDEEDGLIGPEFGVAFSPNIATEDWVSKALDDIGGQIENEIGAAVRIQAVMRGRVERNRVKEMRAKQKMKAFVKMTGRVRRATDLLLKEAHDLSAEDLAAAEAEVKAELDALDINVEPEAVERYEPAGWRVHYPAELSTILRAEVEAEEQVVSEPEPELELEPEPKLKPTEASETRRVGAQKTLRLVPLSDWTEAQALLWANTLPIQWTVQLGSSFEVAEVDGHELEKMPLGQLCLMLQVAGVSDELEASSTAQMVLSLRDDLLKAERGLGPDPAPKVQTEPEQEPLPPASTAALSEDVAAAIVAEAVSPVELGLEGLSPIKLPTMPEDTELPDDNGLPVVSPRPVGQDGRDRRRSSVDRETFDELPDLQDDLMDMSEQELAMIDDDSDGASDEDEPKELEPQPAHELEWEAQRNLSPGYVSRTVTELDDNRLSVTIHDQRKLGLSFGPSGASWPVVESFTPDGLFKASGNKIKASLRLASMVPGGDGGDGVVAAATGENGGDKALPLSVKSVAVSSDPPPPCILRQPRPGAWRLVEVNGQTGPQDMTQLSFTQAKEVFSTAGWPVTLIFAKVESLLPVSRTVTETVGNRLSVAIHDQGKLDLNFGPSGAAWPVVASIAADGLIGHYPELMAGMHLAGVNGQTGLSYNEATEVFRTAGRPMKLIFAEVETESEPEPSANKLTSPPKVMAQTKFNAQVKVHQSDSWWLAALEKAAPSQSQFERKGTVAVARSGARAEVTTLAAVQGRVDAYEAEVYARKRDAKNSPHAVKKSSNNRKQKPKPSQAVVALPLVPLQKAHVVKLQKVKATMSTQPTPSRRLKQHRKVVTKRPQPPPKRSAKPQSSRLPFHSSGEPAPPVPSKVASTKAPVYNPTVTGSIASSGGLVLPSNDDESAWTAFIEDVAEQEARNADALLLQIVGRIEGRTPPKDGQKQDEVRNAAPSTNELDGKRQDLSSVGAGGRQRSRRKDAQQRAKVALDKQGRLDPKVSTAGRRLPRSLASSESAASRAGVALVEAKKVALTHVLKALGAEKKAPAYASGNQVGRPPQPSLLVFRKVFRRRTLEATTKQSACSTAPR